MERHKRGLYVENLIDGLRLIVEFDQGSTQGELVIPLTINQAAKLVSLLRSAIDKRQTDHAARLPVVVWEPKTGRHNA